MAARQLGAPLIAMALLGMVGDSPAGGYLKYTSRLNAALTGIAK